MAQAFTPSSPDDNIFQYGGNIVNAQTGATTPVAPAVGAGAAAPVPTPMPPAVKTNLEATANATGSALSSVPTNPNPSSPASTPTDANGNPISSPSDFNINDALASLTKPTAPDTAALQSDAEARYGVTGLQTTLNDQNTQLTALQNDLQNRQAQEASKPGVVATIINGRMRMLSAEDSKALNDLKASIAGTQRQLTQANTAVATYMKNKQTDYANAEKQYQTDYANTLKLYTDSVSQQDKAQAAAKANAQVIINSYKGSSVGANSITPDDEAQWTALEHQAGLPPGTIKAAVNAELNVQKFIKGSDGYTYVNGIDANGNPYTARVEGSYGAGSGKKSSAAPPKQNPSKPEAKVVSTMANALQGVAGSDGYVNPKDWQDALTEWTGAGYSTASFITAFKKYANLADTTNHYAGIK